MGVEHVGPKPARANKRAAWRLRVYGEACSLRGADTTTCEDGGAYSKGWKMYRSARVASRRRARERERLGRRPNAIDGSRAVRRARSAERFYEGPLLRDGLVPGAGDARAPHTGPAQPNCSGGVLAFTAWNSFKQSHEATGSFALTEVATGNVAAAGEFAFLPYWQPTLVSGVALDLSTGTGPVEAVLWVNNSRGRGVSRVLECNR